MKALSTLKKSQLFLASLVIAALPVSLPAKSLNGFSPQQVKVTSGPMAHAQQTNVQYLLKMDPDRLLAPYLREAGIKPKQDSYGNWENTGLDGHIGGHYLSALSLAWAATGDAELKRRLDYMIDQLDIAQQKSGGYLGGIPKGTEAWQQIKKGKIKADLFSLNDRWVPLYNIDKIYHGLRDAYQIGKNAKAKTMLIQLGHWMLDLVQDLSDEQIQKLLYSEHGGLNEVFVDIANFANDNDFIELARQFSHLTVIKPLLVNQDQLTGMHANTQIPKIIGMMRYAQATNNQDWLNGVKFFWQTITSNRSVSIGGNSVREHFHDSSDFTAMVEDIEGPETCNTYNMMKLSQLLFEHTGEVKYLDYYERASYNHILSSQHPEHGGLVYFTSMRPGHYRMYSSVEDSMWCCVGSGIENHSKYGELIYSQRGDELLINLFIPSSLNWQDRGLSISQQTRFPDEQQVTLTIDRIKKSQQTINIRSPYWLNNQLSVKVNGNAIPTKVVQGYVQVTRHWQAGDTITLDLDVKTYTEQLPDGQQYYSILYGPVVMATKVDAYPQENINFVSDDSRMGHIAAGPVCPPEAVPIMLSEPDAFIRSMKKLPGQLAFDLSEGVTTIEQGHLKQPTRLIPFFRLHDSRYQVYWPQLNADQFDQYAVDVKQQSAAKLALQQKTVDAITPGQQQPEVEHKFKGENTRAGINNGHHWRDAHGWFSYELSNPKQSAKILQLTFFKHDTGREFDILVNDTVFKTVALPALKSEQDYYQVNYELSDAIKAMTSFRLTFKAKPGSIAGGIYGISLLKE